MKRSEAERLIQQVEELTRAYVTKVIENPGYASVIKPEAARLMMPILTGYFLALLEGWGEQQGYSGAEEAWQNYCLLMKGADL